MVQKYTWSDGTVYQGELEGQDMTGKGMISWPSGATYDGDFSGNFLHGSGTLTKPDGSLYVGAWRMNIPYGLGRKHYLNSDTYDGSWKHGVLNGFGRYTWSNGSTYIGNFKDGKFWGKGVMKWVNNDLFDGFWVNGLRHGSGIHKFADGGLYIGTWSRDVKDGRGSFFPTGSNKYPPLVHCRSLEYNMKGDRVLSRSLSLMLEKSPYEKEIQDQKDAVMYERQYMQGVLMNERVRHYTELLNKHKLRSKFSCKEAKKRTIFDVFNGHRSYCLMLNLQLGIRYTVGMITPAPVRDVRSSDFEDRARIRMYFPRIGSQLTPPHYSIDFYWMDYCPMVFRNLREMFKIDAADYMVSICGDDGLRELPSPGKSGSIFYLSHDDRFVIKTLKTSELKVLLKMLPYYYKHVEEHENTLITKFFGLHQIALSSGRKIHFVVMGNMFCTELRIHDRYDLKGSTQGRFTENDKIGENTTLKDLDLSYEFQMDKSLRESLFRQVSLDCMFLKSQQIIDYSLLLGVHFRAPDFEHPNSVPDSVANVPLLLVSETELPIPPKGLLLVTHEPRFVRTVPGSHIRGSALKAFSAGDKEVDLLLPETGRLQVQLGVNMPARAKQKLQQDESCSMQVEVYDVVLYLGVIDILQAYNTKKKLEHTYKSWHFDPLSVSAIEPKRYSKRFISFLEKVFPD